MLCVCVVCVCCVCVCMCVCVVCVCVCCVCVVCVCVTMLSEEEVMRALFCASSTGSNDLGGTTRASKNCFLVVVDETLEDACRTRGDLNLVEKLRTGNFQRIPMFCNKLT